MTWKQLFDAIKDGTASGVYLFYGPEEFIKRSAVDRLREAFLPAGLEALNEAILEGAGVQEIIESAETLPVMCDKRLVIVKEWAPLVGAKAKDAEEETKKLEAWLMNAPSECITVFYLRDEPDKRLKAYKVFEKHANVVPFPYLPDVDIEKWLKSRLKKDKKTITSQAAQMLIFMTGHELTRLSGEADKLAAYVGDRSEINEQDVQAVVTPGVESNVFMMIDELMAKNAKHAYEILNAMLDAGESHIRILAAITRQLRLLTHVKMLKDEKLSLPEIEKRTGLAEFIVKRVYKQTGKTAASAFQEGYRMSVEYDYLVKSGRVREDEALDAMILKLHSLS